LGHPNNPCASNCLALAEHCERSSLVSRSVENLFATLDRVDAPDLWTEIVARSATPSSNSRVVQSGRDLESARVEVELDNPGKRGDMNHSRWAVVLAVAAAAVVVIVALAMIGDRGDTPIDQTPATDPASPSETLPSETLPSPFGAEEALRVIDAYFDASNSGDVEAVLTLFAPDATFNLSGPVTRAEFDQLATWNAAQGTVLRSPECDATVVVTGEEVDVRCRFDHLDALAQAADGPPVPMSMMLTVTTDGISDLIRTIGSPDFDAVGVPFGIWMLDNNPDDADRVGFGRWNSVEEAEQNGQLTVEYAADWAAYLEANDCVDRTGSGPLTFVVTC
jgi:ketosteroid isomerase-like protein